MTTFTHTYSSSLRVSPFASKHTQDGRFLVVIVCCSDGEGVCLEVCLIRYRSVRVSFSAQVQPHHCLAGISTVWTQTWDPRGQRTPPHPHCCLDGTRAASASTQSSLLSQAALPLDPPRPHPRCGRRRRYPRQARPDETEPPAAAMAWGRKRGRRGQRRRRRPRAGRVVAISLS